MKKILLVLLITLTIVGCLHKKDNAPQTGSVTVAGDIKNEALAWQNYIPTLFKKAFAVDTISTRSTLVVVDPERLAAVSVATGVRVDADVINTTPARINGYRVDIFIEDEIFLTKENWNCAVCYPFVGGGKDCEQIWLTKGNTIFETEPSPPLQTCQAGSGTQELCVTKFKDGVDCSSPDYVQEHVPAGNGLQELSMHNISVAALSNLASTVGVQSNSWVTGSNKYARFTVYNNTSMRMFQKDYVFDVVN